MNANALYGVQDVRQNTARFSAKNRGMSYRYLKRMFDILLSIICLFLFLPLCIFISVLIKLDSSGTVFFKQIRIGRNGQPFRIFKFRTMQSNAPAEVATWELSNANQYITRIGKFLRRTSLDELPQILNVMVGDMSFIGPRPLVLAEKKIHSLRFSRGVYQLKPGITGLAQISGRDYVNPEEKVKLDEKYLHSFSFRTDVKICFKTVFVVFCRKGICEGSQNFNVDLIPEEFLNVAESSDCR
jgi:O-antigen biosynthesis protein WbqP